MAKLLRPRFTVPDERIIRDGDRADACFFIASGAVEVRLPARRIRLGSGEFFGELALLTGRPRQADVVALTYCRLLVLRKADFERFLAENPAARAEINRVALARLAMNQGETGVGDRPTRAGLARTLLGTRHRVAGRGVEAPEADHRRRHDHGSAGRDPQAISPEARPQRRVGLRGHERGSPVGMFRETAPT